MKKICLALSVVVTLLSSLNLFAGWTKTFGGEYDDEAYWVEATADGCFIVTGYTKSEGLGLQDMWLLKIDSKGKLLWQETYGGTLDEKALCVQETSDGGYIISGITRTFGDGLHDDVWLVKTDSSGEEEWAKTYGGGDVDWGYCVRQMPDEGYVLAGFTKSFGAGGRDLWLLRLDPDGDTVWTRTWGGDGSDYGYCVEQTSDLGFIISGSTGSYGDSSEDIWLVKTSPQGDTLWTRTFGEAGFRDRGWSVRQTGDGGYVVAGETESSDSQGKAACLIKTDPLGNEEWNLTYDVEGDDYGYSVLEVPGGYAVTGETNTSAGGKDLLLFKAHPLGYILWTQTYGGKEWDAGRSVCKDSEGNIITAGYTASTGSGLCDAWLIKTFSNGDTLVGIAENPRGQPGEWLVLTQVGERVIFEYGGIPGGFCASVFDASGRKVDELSTPNQSGVLVWDPHQTPGVYFIVPEYNGAQASKVVLVR